MNKIINFINRTRHQIYLAFIMLRNRYKKVKFHIYIHCGMFYGWFEVEKQYKKLKYA